MDTQNKIKILIIEDELLIAEDMRLQLEELGYEVVGIASEYQEAIALFNQEMPDIILIDVVIEGEKDGIELASELKKLQHVPIIFITSHADKPTVERAKSTKPDGYLVKPFDSKDLYAAIEIAFFNHVNQDNKTEVHEENQSFTLKNYIFIKKDYLLVKIRFDELRYIKAEGNYVEIFCKNKKFLTRSTLKDFLSKLPKDKFIQVHKSYAVNIELIDAFEYNNLVIGNEKIPLSRNMATEIKKRLQIDI